MNHRFLRVSGPLSLVALAASCNTTVLTFPGGQGGAGSSTGSGAGTSGQVTSSSGVTSSGVTSSGVTSSGVTSSGVTSSSSGGPCLISDPNMDLDGDGWTPAQGDCNDCDPNVNPGGFDVPGDSNMVDHDCDGKYDPPQPCDGSLALDDVNAPSGAMAIELCQVTTEAPATPQQKTWGVISSTYVRANGAAFAAPGVQVGIQSIWGLDVNPQGGKNMLAISSGHARTTAQTDACGSESCSENAAGTPPPGFPQNNPSCPPSPMINDDVGLQLQIRTPTNATGYAFDFKFYSMEFPYWVCTTYNDQFIALMSPAPAGAINGNICLDGMNNPVSVNLGFFDVCDPTQISQYAVGCTMGGTTCPTAPTPYCPSGNAQLQGTGFDVWDTSYGNAGATSWLTTQAPITGGQEISLRFAIWDSGDQLFDSTTLIDDFRWLAGPGPVTLSTTRVLNPK